MSEQYLPHEAQEGEMAALKMRGMSGHVTRTWPRVAVSRSSVPLSFSHLNKMAMRDWYPIESSPEVLTALARVE